MKTFEEFFLADNYELKQIVENSQGNMISNIDNVISHLPDKAIFSSKNDFAKDVSDLVYGKDFIKELSNHISTPRPEESEEDFVIRSSMQMLNLLKYKFIKK